MGTIQIKMRSILNLIGTMANDLIEHDLLVHRALDHLLESDHYLLANNLSERSITHKLAEHLQDLFTEWDVDCEFNTNLGEPKKIVIDPEEILRQMANKLEENGYLQKSRSEPNELNRDDFPEQMRDLERQLRDPSRIRRFEELDIVVFLLNLDRETVVEKTIFPDVIVHHRGTNDNHIVLEAKKTINVNRKARAYDIIKLMTMTSSHDFHYRRGYFIDLPVLEKFSITHGFLDSQLEYGKVYKIDPLYSG